VSARTAAARHVRAHPTQLDMFLQPGEWFVGDATHRVRTLLGSCVSVTLWSPQARVGAMSHSLLPTRGRRPPADTPPDGRYGDEALELMLQGLAAAGVPSRECAAKIFGGGDLFGAGGAHGVTVGRRNGQAARELLRRHGIEVASESLFGEGHRQILFDIATGEVWARQIPPQAPAHFRGPRARSRSIA
jgi:chemotaxis protein CheD